MGLRETFNRLTGPGAEPAPQGTEQTFSRPELPSLDLAAPKDFQTATFAYG
jgi:hypothetical protein